MKRPESGLSLEASLLVFRLRFAKLLIILSYHSCTVPIGNQDIHRNPNADLSNQECTSFHKLTSRISMPCVVYLLRMLCQQYEKFIWALCI